MLSGTSKSPQFPKKKEKMSLSEMQKQKISTDLSLVPGSVPNVSQIPSTSSSTVPSSSSQDPQVEIAQKPEQHQQQQQHQPVKRAPGGAKAVVVNSVNTLDQNSAAAEVKTSPEETTLVKLSDLNVPLSSIRPSPSIPPLTLPIESAAETGKHIQISW